MNCTGTGPTLCTVIKDIIGYLDNILLLIMAVAVVMFVWYVFKYFIKADSDKKEAGTYVMYSLIGFFVILSMWGLVRILTNTFKISNSTYSAPSSQDLQNLFPRK
jgi:hypothetical protein